MEKREELRTALAEFLDENLERLICSNPRSRDHFIKMTVRPLLIKGALKFHVEEFTEKQAFQKNLEKEEALDYVMGQLQRLYRNAEASSAAGTMHVLISKKGAVTCKVKRKMAKMAAKGTPEGTAVSASSALSKLDLSHNRAKRYVLPEGTPVPFLVDLGVMTPEGRVVKAKYDKFRQINRFLGVYKRQRHQRLRAQRGPQHHPQGGTGIYQPLF